MKRRSATISKGQEDPRFDMGSSVVPNTINELIQTCPPDLSEDTSIDELVENLKEAAVTTRGLHQNGLGGKIYQAILVIDSELNSTMDEQFRKRLVKTAYSLRSLEEAIIESGQ